MMATTRCICRARAHSSSVLLFLTALTLGSLSAPAPLASQSPAATAFVGVTVVPMSESDGPRVLRNQTVLIREGRIAAVGPASEVRVPTDARRIDGTGRWLVPGLIDAHVHLFSRSDLDLYLANGVTTIVNLGGCGAADSILDIRRSVAASEIDGPTIFTSGNWLDGDPPFREINTIVRTPAEARTEVAAQHAAGYDFIKVYATLSPHVYEAILAAAREHEMPVTGHIPNAVGVDGVLAGGQQGIAHGGAIVFQALGFDPETSAVEELARRVAGAGAAVTTTLWMVELAFKQRTGPAGIAEIAARPEMRYLPPARRGAWRDDNMFAQFPRLSASEGRARLRLVRRFVAALVRAGVPVHAGTDSDVAGSVPGFSLHEELRSLRTATSASATWLSSVLKDVEPFGTIEAGRRADLLLIEADPLEDIEDLRRPAGVMVRGRWYPPEDLAARLAEAEAR